jgi:hypothetical protein
MADTKITALTALTAADPANDVIPIVDVSDTTMAASGTTKKISVNNILGASGTATLASAAITGAATVGTTLGVTGVSTFAAGTAALPALTTTGDTNTGIYYPAADTFAVTTGGTERYRVDSSGNFLIGTSTALGKVRVRNGSGQNFVVDVSNSNQVSLQNYGSTGDGGWQELNLFGSPITFSTGTAGGTSGSEKARIDASGNLLVGSASFAVNNGKLRIEHSGLAGEWGIQTKSSTTDGYVGVFYTTTGQAGFISVSGTSTTFSTTSDYRLKESVQPLIGGLARINNLKPSTYKWKADGSNSEGFIAHELAEVVPAAVTGQKDAVNADGSIKPQGVDLSKLVPIVVAAIQELTARVQTLEAR